MYWGLGVCENVNTPTCISPYLISGISSSLPVDVGQKPNHVNPWCSFVCACLFSDFGFVSFLLFISWRSFYSHNIFTINLGGGSAIRRRFPTTNWYQSPGSLPRRFGFVLFGDFGD